MDITSKRVYEETYSYISIPVTLTEDAEANKNIYLDAYKELNVFRKEYYGDDISDNECPIESYTDEYGNIILRFATMYSSAGKDLHPQIYPHAVDARSLM